MEQLLDSRPTIILLSWRARMVQFHIYDLKKHLEGELNKVDDKLKAEEKAVKDETKKIISKDDLQNDNQLNTSLAVLKSLIIMNK